MRNYNRLRIVFTTLLFIFLSDLSIAQNMRVTDPQSDNSSSNQNFSTAACGIPAGVNASNVTASSATINYSAVSGANEYVIKYRKWATSSWSTKTTSATSKSISGLSSASVYEIQVKAVCSSGSGNYTSTYTFTTSTPSCGIASGFSASSITTTGATVRWTAVSGASSYNVQYKANSSSSWTTVSTTSASKALTGLSAGTVYQYQVQTVCTGGNSSYSSASTFTTTSSTAACNTPNVNSFGTLNITSSSANVYWSSVSGALSYIVQYRPVNTTAWSNVSTTSASSPLTGLSASTKYEFQVQTVCSAGNGPFSSSGVFTTSAYTCGDPVSSSFVVSSITNTGATVNWTAVSGATGYMFLYRVVNSSAAWTSVSVSTNSITLSGLTSATNYEYQIQTTCSAGYSGFSSVQTFTTTGQSCGAAVVSTFTSSNRTSSSANVGWASVSGATGYTVRYRIKAIAGAWTSVTTSTTSASLTSLSASSEYEFQVQVNCTGGTGTFSASGLFSTTSSNGCSLASGMYVTSISNTSGHVYWTAVSGASSYVIQFRKSGTSAWTSQNSVSASETLSNLSSGTTYEYQIETICSSGSSGYTTPLTFTTSGVPSGGGTGGGGNGGPLPVPDHIVVVIFENHSFNQIIGSSAAPRINALATQANSCLFTESYGIEHPSQPNYLDLFSGSNQGVTSNVKPSSKFTTMNLARALLNAGKTFNYYSDGLPSAGSDVESSGAYARKHNALANWVGTGNNQVPSSMNLPFTSFPTDFTTLPTVSFVSPDLNNSMHDGSGSTAISNGDTWFYNKINAYAQWAKTHNSLLILTFDEDDNVSSNHITTIFTGQMVVAGENDMGINHYNVLRTIEDMYGLVHSGNAANVDHITGCWTNGARMSRPVVEQAKELNVSVFPNPVKDHMSVHYTLSETSDVEIRLIDALGKIITEEKYKGVQSGDYTYDLLVSAYNLNDGIYFIDMTVNGRRIVKRVMVENN